MGGRPGPKGRQGPQGNIGQPGATGSAGEPGETGRKGAPGIRGPQGPPGLSGAKGDKVWYYVMSTMSTLPHKLDKALERHGYTSPEYEEVYVFNEQSKWMVS